MIANMACCLCKSSHFKESRRSHQIDKMLREDKRRLRREIRILLLGAGESGKSTIIKQMKIIHGESLFDDESVEEVRHNIYQNILKGIKVLIDARSKLEIEWGNAEKVANAVNLVSRVDTKNKITPEYFFRYVSLIDCIWNDSGIQQTYQRRNLFQLSDGFYYLMSNLKRISSGKYIPTNADILHSRVPTKSVIEFSVKIKGVPFVFIDVGGQRAQRTKWLSCLDNVSSILFIVSSIEYDQFLVEERSKNRLEESLAIFETIINHESFNTISSIIFFNKTDLLIEKLKNIRERKKHLMKTKKSDTFNDTIDLYFPQFHGDPTDLKQVQSFFIHLFQSKCHIRREKRLYFHWTTAVSTENISLVFKDVRSVILEQNLAQIMLN